MATFSAVGCSLGCGTGCRPRRLRCLNVLVNQDLVLKILENQDLVLSMLIRGSIGHFLKWSLFYIIIRELLACTIGHLRLEQHPNVAEEAIYFLQSLSSREPVLQYLSYQAPRGVQTSYLWWTTKMNHIFQILGEQKPFMMEILGPGSNRAMQLCSHKEHAKIPNPDHWSCILVMSRL